MFAIRVAGRRRRHAWDAGVSSRACRPAWSAWEQGPQRRPGRDRRPCAARSSTSRSARCRSTSPGRRRIATVVNGSLPGPILRFREGETVTLNVRNTLAESSSIHWHGLLLPNAMDGVPGLTFRGIAPGETFTYRFPVRQSGTYWYHSHSGMQEQTGLYGPLILEPRGREPYAYQRDYVVMLSDWTDEDPMTVVSQSQAAERLLQLQAADGRHLRPRRPARRARSPPSTTG